MTKKLSSRIKMQKIGGCSDVAGRGRYVCAEGRGGQRDGAACKKTGYLPMSLRLRRKGASMSRQLKF